MSETRQLTPADLPDAMRQFAFDLGNDAYKGFALDGYAKTEEYWPSGRGSESFIKFKTQRVRDEVGGPILGAHYSFEQGTTTYLKELEPEIVAALDDRYDLDGEEQFWVTENRKLTIAHTFAEGGLILELEDLHFGTGDEIIFEVPIVSGQRVMSDDLAAKAQSEIVEVRDGMRLAEVRLPDEDIVKPQLDDLDILMQLSGESEANKMDEMMRRIAGHMALWQ